MCLKHWIVPFGIPAYLLTDKGPHFVSKCFATVRGYLGIQHITTTLFHLQTNGQAERCNQTISTRQRHHVSNHQQKRNLFKPLTYTNNTKMHRTSNTSPYCLVMSRQPPGPLLLSAALDKTVCKCEIYPIDVNDAHNSVGTNRRLTL